MGRMSQQRGPEVRAGMDECTAVSDVRSEEAVLIEATETMRDWVTRLPASSDWARAFEQIADLIPAPVVLPLQLVG